MECPQEPEVMTFMTESLHLVPEDLDDDILEEMWKYILSVTAASQELVLLDRFEILQQQE